MKTIILAAGKATRLQPLTKDIPQALLEIGGKKILEKQFDALSAGGVKKEDIIVVTGYLFEEIERFCQKHGIETSFNPFFDVSGTAASLWSVKHELTKGFLFLYSDVLFDKKLIQKVLNNQEDIVLAIKKNGLRPEAEKVIESAGIITGIGKATTDKENGEFIGVAKFSEAGAEKITEEIKNTLKGNLDASFIDMIHNLLSQGEKITACDIESSLFIDIDFPVDFEKAKEIFN